MDCGSTILIFLAFIHATCGQPVTLTGPPDGAIEQGRDTVFTCTGGTAPYTFQWTDLSVNPNVAIFISGELGYIPPAFPKYDNFNVSKSGGTTSTMTIYNTLIEDEGEYRCSEVAVGDTAVLTVEVKSARTLEVESTVDSNNIDVYVATCEAVGGRPNETITWMLGDGPSPCDATVVKYPEAEEDLFSTTSDCTFQATSDNNNGQTLKCVISGHLVLVPDLNGEETTTLPVHSAPRAGIITMRFQSTDSGLTVSCVIADPDQPEPSIRNYYIYSNDSLIHQSSTEDNNVDVPASEFDLNTEFTCVAGNYLGNVTSDPTKYDPDSTTTLTPTTTAEPITTEGTTTYSSGLPTTEPSMTTIKNDTRTPTANTLGAGAIAGIAIGVIACIVIIVVIVLYFLKPECCPCFAGSGSGSGSSNKPTGRAVGSSNGSGSEKDVESPLNGVKDVTAEEKTRPEAAPRGHGSIQHTQDNPDQAMYAMVDKKKPSGGGGGDAPDTRGSGQGQNEPGSMLYADLDLSHKAGHTDKHVPKNESDVVVYSSILV